MKFFKVKDIIRLYENMPDDVIWCEYLVDRLNTKLFNSGRVVYGQSTDQRYWTDINDPSTQYVYPESDIKALLINIEPIEQCKHPKEKVKYLEAESEKYVSFWFCECGVKVQPKGFEEVK